MTDERQLEQFGEAVERKKEAAREAAGRGPQNPREPAAEGAEQSARVDRAHTQDERDVRAKNSRHKHVTADKWNQ